jgi:hypothetical protein
MRCTRFTSLAVSLGLAASLVASPLRRVRADEPTLADAPAIEASACTDCYDCGDYCSCGGGCVAGPVWYASADALFLELDGTDALIAVDQNTLDPQLTLGDADYDFEIGPRITVGYGGPDRWGVEGSYFGIYDWSGSASVVGANNLALAGDIAFATDDFFGADAMSVTTEAEIHSAELNLVSPTSSAGLSFLAGFRYVNFEETIDIRSTDSDTEISDYLIDASNNLYGGQLGARLRRGSGAILFDVTGKAGIYGNDAEQRQLLGDFGNTFLLRDVSSSQSDVAFLGEVGVNGLLELMPGLYLRSGYNVIFIEGIARAGDQIDLTDSLTAGTATNLDGAFLHGANVGLEAIW